MMDDIKREPLGAERCVFVSPRHGFGTDAFLLADFSRPKRKDRAVDLGTGCGIIPSLWLCGDNVGSVVGVDISDEACELAAMTAETNGDGEKFSVMKLDLRCLKGSLPQEEFDLVSCNPPYFTPDSGYVAPDSLRAQARAELSCTVEDVCAAAKYLLRYGGRLCVCFRPERLVDLLTAMRGYGIEPKRLRMVQNSVSGAPWLALVEGRRGGKSSLAVERPFIMTSPDGSCSDELETLYRDYREGRKRK